jgi:RNA polymerase sigma factor (sigma-70 family)
MTDSQKLIAEYAKEGSETAFRELVAAYIDLVYSVAVRLMDGDAHLAEDVTQIVFADLARKAPTLSCDVMVGGWLHRHTCFVAAKTMRGARRRKAREKQAVEMNELQNQSETNLAWVAPILDEAIDKLGTQDRAAILLRYFEQRDLRSIGEALGTSEDAARKRVNRALDKLHSLLKRRGITYSAVTLSAALGAQAVTAAPAGLAASVATSALAAGASTASTTFAIIRLMTATKLKVGIISAVVIATVATPLALQHQTEARLRDENESLRRQVSQLSQQATENQRPARREAQAANPSALTNEQLNELLRLRGEVTRLKAREQELAQSKAASAKTEADPMESAAQSWAVQVKRLKDQLAQMPEKSIPELQLLNDQDWFDAVGQTNLMQTDADIREALNRLRRTAKNKLAPLMQQALGNYTKANNEQLPGDMSQLAPFFEEPVDDSVLQRYELLYTGKLADVPPNQPLVVEKAPVDEKYDTRYLFYMNGTGAASWPTNQLSKSK